MQCFIVAQSGSAPPLTKKQTRSFIFCEQMFLKISQKSEPMSDTRIDFNGLVNLFTVIAITNNSLKCFISTHYWRWVTNS